LLSEFAVSADDQLLTGNLSYWKLGQDNLRVAPFYTETGDELPFNQLFQVVSSSAKKPLRTSSG
jgi:hypothetical protein